jgi:uncharacterized phiE125 gp8 family phage protein
MLRAHLQLTHTADDDLILGVGGYLEEATAETENRGNVSLIRQSRKQYIGPEAFPVAGQSFALLNGPVVTVTAVKYLDENDAVQTYPATSYRTSGDEIYFKENPPTLAEGANTIWIEYTAGFGDTPASIGSGWRKIVMMLAYRAYELRGESPGNTPDAWERMIDRQIVIAGGSRRG